MAPAVAASPTSVGPEFFRQDMPLEQLQSSPLNPRQHFDAARLAELAQSFAGVGIIEPLVARPVGDHYEIICGERRSRAARLAGLATVPVIVKPLTDTHALEVMVIENNQREDVNALEEGDGFRRLLEAGYELEKLAERLGRSKKYIYDRIKLLDLQAPAKRLLLGGKLTAGHAILLARLKPEDQLRAIDVDQGGAFARDTGMTEEEEELADQAWENHDDDSEERYAAVKPASVRELNRWIAQHVRFDVQHAATAAPLEYGDVARRVDEANAKTGRGKKVVAITFGHYLQPETRTEAERTFGPQSFKLADGREHYDIHSARSKVAPICEFGVLGVVAAGERYGQAFDVCIARDKCKVHWKDEIAAREKVQKAQKGPAAKNSAQQQKESWEAKHKREREERDRRDRAWDGVRVTALERLAAALKKSAASGHVVQAAWELSQHVYDNSDRKLLATQFGKITTANLPAALVFVRFLLDESRDHDEFVKAAKAFGVDVADLSKQYKQLLQPPADKVPASATAAVKSKPSKAKKKR